MTSLAPHFFQVAYIVRDLAAAEAWFQRMLGIPHFERMDGVALGATCRHRGAPADATLDLSLGFAGDVQIELIRPGRGESIHAEFLASGRTGLHHVGYLVPDFAAATAHLAAQGRTSVADGVLEGGMRIEFAYFDVEDAGASVIEILGFDEAAHAFMAELKAKGAP